VFFALNPWLASENIADWFSFNNVNTPGPHISKRLDSLVTAVAPWVNLSKTIFFNYELLDGDGGSGTGVYVKIKPVSPTVVVEIIDCQAALIPPSASDLLIKQAAPGPIDFLEPTEDTNFVFVLDTSSFTIKVASGSLTHENLCGSLVYEVEPAGSGYYTLSGNTLTVNTIGLSEADTTLSFYIRNNYRRTKIIESVF